MEMLAQGSLCYVSIIYEVVDLLKMATMMMAALVMMMSLEV